MHRWILFVTILGLVKIWQREEETFIWASEELPVMSVEMYRNNNFKLKWVLIMQSNQIPLIYVCRNSEISRPRLLKFVLQEMIV
jgi:hypothetical protein